MTDETSIKPDLELDLSGVRCPINYVKAKLKLETMGAGQVLELILDDGEPIRNVPRSLEQDGHQIIVNESWGDRQHRVLVRKSA